MIHSFRIFRSRSFNLAETFSTMFNDKHLSVGSKAPPLENGKLRLYSMRYCPYAQRVHLVLNSKNIPQKPDWFLEKSLLGKVPCIELENGDAVYESLIISEYLDEIYPKHNLLPKDLLAKAKDKIFIERFNAVSTPMYKLYVGKGVDEDLFNDVLKGLDVFDKELARRGTPFFSGNQPGMLDLMIWPWFEKTDILKPLRGNYFVIPEGRYSKLSTWKVAMKEDPAVKASIPDVESHVKYMKSYVAGATQYDF